MSAELEIAVLAWPAFKNRQANPYNWLLYRCMKSVKVREFSVWQLLRKRYDIWHMHWPEYRVDRKNAFHAALETWFVIRLIDYARRRGTRIIWTAHNLGSHAHRHPDVESWFWPNFIKRVDCFISLSRSGIDVARSKFPALKHVPAHVVFHGHYRDAYPATPGNAREFLRMDLNSPVALFFGKIRPYKNVAALIKAFRTILSRDISLVIAGLPESRGLASVVEHEAQGDPRIHLHLEHIPSATVSAYFLAADLVILPYREILNSGTALLALSFNRPVLVPDMGAMAELQDIVGRSWVRTYRGEINGEQIETALSWATNETREDEAPLRNLGWDTLARQTEKVYETTLSKGRRIPE